MRGAMSSLLPHISRAKAVPDATGDSVAGKMVHLVRRSTVPAGCAVGTSQFARIVCHCASLCCQFGSHRRIIGDDELETGFAKGPHREYRLPATSRTPLHLRAVDRRQHRARPFGEAVRSPLSPVEIVHLLARVGAYGVNFHDNDLVPIDATPAERDRIVHDFRAALHETGLVVPMATTNLFSDPAFRDGAFTANDPAVRAYAMQKTIRAIDLGVELGAKLYVFWGGREGVETDAAKDPVES